MPKKPELERDVEEYLVAYAAKLGMATFKLEVRGKRGMPDRMVLYNRGEGKDTGRVAFFELKRPVGGQTAMRQIKRLMDMRARGYVCDILSTKDEVTAALDALVYGTNKQTNEHTKGTRT